MLLLKFMLYFKSEGIFSVNPLVNVDDVEQCSYEIGTFINNFENVYPGLANYHKFQLELFPTR